MSYRNNLTSVFIAAVLCSVTGCASVPQEAVELSAAVSNDIEQLYTAYRQTVQTSFEHMRQTGLTLIDERWTPAYLKSLIAEGDLVDYAKQDNTAAVEYWARGAIEDIDAKRRAFLEPLQAREAKLLADIDEAFGQTRNMSTTLTGYLGSIREVEKVEDRILNHAGLENIRKRLNDGVISASEFATELTGRIQADVDALAQSDSP